MGFSRRVQAPLTDLILTASYKCRTGRGQLLLAPKAPAASSGAHNHPRKPPERDSPRRCRAIVFGVRRSNLVRHGCGNHDARSRARGLQEGNRTPDPRRSWSAGIWTRATVSTAKLSQACRSMGSDGSLRLMRRSRATTEIMAGLAFERRAMPIICSQGVSLKRQIGQRVARLCAGVRRATERESSGPRLFAGSCDRSGPRGRRRGLLGESTRR